MKSTNSTTDIGAELSIRNVIARYGLAVDCGDIETAVNCHTNDATYKVANPNAGRGSETQDLELRGHEAITKMLNSEIHQSLLPSCAHTVGPLVVKVKGKTAVALGYSRVYHNNQLMRLAVNKWTMKVVNGQWRIDSRESRIVGDEKAQLLIKKGLHDTEL